MTASLYTHVMRYCADPLGCGFKRVPCRGHRKPRQQVLQAIDEASELRPRREVKPMTDVRRIQIYRTQGPMTGPVFTPRQFRQFNRMARRAEYRAARGAS